ncbi:ABC transporter ATP-binding protein [Phytohabitans kaempferiae]|uniref:ABC transporter ATP-binding protein n=1 Tax=Phytohabitans kaempferiae TaxID=1620943 RepID=A0ABV6M5G3_9ACTN
MLRIHEVSKSYGGVRALSGVSLAVDPGEVVGLLGPNGAGKSTLIDAVAGAIDIDHGSVTFDGGDVTGVPAWERARRGVGRTFQRIRLVPTLSVFDNVAMPRPGRARDLGRVRAVLDEYGLTRWAQVMARDLPAGVQRLVEVARVLVSDPKLVLLDEPLAGLGEHEIELFETALHRMRSPLRSIVLVDHNAPFVLSVVTRACLMVQGELLLDGTRDEVRNSEVARRSYLGNPAEETAS